MKILYALLGLIEVKYNPILVSKILINSLENNKEWMKSHRLNWLSVSLREAQTYRTKWWNISTRRIVIWLNDYWDLYLLDGRHLLEAYRLLKKYIPNRVICFISNDVKKVFTKNLKSLDC